MADSLGVGGALSVVGNTSLGGNLNIAGTVTIAGTGIQAANAKVCASAFYGDGSNLTNVPATGATSVSALRITGNATIGGTLSVGGAC